MKKVLIISNGLGEDSIGAVIAKSLLTNTDVHAMALVGKGTAYQINKIPLVGPGAIDSHLGNRRYKYSFLKDLTQGAIQFMFKQIDFLKSQEFDEIICVGDIYSVLICYFSGQIPVRFIGVYKSTYSHSYQWYEKYLLKRQALTVWTRDAKLSVQLTNAGVNARYDGNIIMDTIAISPNETIAPSDLFTIVILPGSRKEARENLRFFLTTLKTIWDKKSIRVIVSRSPDLNFSELYCQLDFSLSPKDGKQLITEYPGISYELLNSADLLLSAAGTSQQQAAGLGKPVIGLLPEGVRKKRKRTISQIMGPLYTPLSRDISQFTQEISRQINCPPSEELKKISKEHIGHSGALSKVISTVISQ